VWFSELPDTSFTRSISNPEAVMRRRRQQKLEKKLQQFRSKVPGQHDLVVMGGFINFFLHFGGLPGTLFGLFFNFQFRIFILGDILGRLHCLFFFTWLP
jgi:hypothetical protein